MRVLEIVVIFGAIGQDKITLSKEKVAEELVPWGKMSSIKGMVSFWCGSIWMTYCEVNSWCV